MSAMPRKQVSCFRRPALRLTASEQHALLILDGERDQLLYRSVVLEAISALPSRLMRFTIVVAWLEKPVLPRANPRIPW